MPGYYDDDDDGVMMGSLELDDSQWQMGARRRRAPRGRSPGMLLPITFPTFSFVLATGINNVSQSVRPEFPFAGQQPIATILRNGTSAGLTFPLLNQLFVGPTPIITTAPGPALDAYRFDAVNNNLRMPPTGVGQTYRADVGLTAALTGTDSVAVILQINGQGKLRPGYVGRTF
jgi:hypothetical protein